MRYMKVLFLCRFQKSPNDPAFQEIEESLKLRELTENDFDKEAARSQLLQEHNNLYDYAPLMLDLKDVGTVNYIDAEHTSLRMYNNVNFTIKMGFYNFVTVYEDLTGLIVNDLTHAIFKQKLITNDESVTTTYTAEPE